MSSPHQPSIEFWFDLSSNYSYLSAMRIEDAAQRAGVGVQWRPFLLGPVFAALGWETSPFVAQKEKGAYVWQDMPRQCRKYGLPWRQPSVFPRRTLLAARIAVLPESEPWRPAWCREIMRMNYGEDRDVDTPEVATDILTRFGLPAARILEAALSDENRQRLRTATQTARAACSVRRRSSSATTCTGETTASTMRWRRPPARRAAATLPADGTAALLPDLPVDPRAARRKPRVGRRALGRPQPVDVHETPVRHDRAAVQHAKVRLDAR